uniref:Uncharacterized protein n=1 Tax=Meloidogyne enterolobii TaxID=390850 RepID=A0A6V7YBC4_MELEN|nr:unnamed protein product [Meloidogyne enterolobii]
MHLGKLIFCFLFIVITGNYYFKKDRRKRIVCNAFTVLKMALSQGSVIIVSYLREFVLKLFVSIAPIKNDFKEIRMIPRLGQNFIFLFFFFFVKDWNARGLCFCTVSYLFSGKIKSGFFRKILKYTVLKKFFGISEHKNLQ